MLVLSRHRGERIRIGDSIEIMVVKIQGCTVRLGITAPADVCVDRDEVRTRIEQKIAAAELPGPIPGEWKESEE